MKLFSYENISIKVYDGVFYPTETSKMFIDFFKSEQDNYSNPNQSLLDLGCGSGVVSVTLKALGFQNSIFASDISESAKLNVIENSKINHDLHIETVNSLNTSWIASFGAPLAQIRRHHYTTFFHVSFISIFHRSLYPAPRLSSYISACPFSHSHYALL